MQREQTEEKSLQVIIGEQLSTVTFVQDSNTYANYKKLKEG